MRKIIVTLFVIAVSSMAYAQPAFQRKDLFLSPALHLGNYRVFNYSTSERYGNPVPLSFAAEYGLTNQISAGAFAGYYSRRYKYVGANVEDTQDDFTYKSHYTVIGIRGTYHFTPALENRLKADLTSEDLDLYVSVLAGYEINNFSRTNGMEPDNKSTPVLGAVFGARYFVSYRFALFGEVGPGILGLGAFGVTARF